MKLWKMGAIVAIAALAVLPAAAQQTGQPPAQAEGTRLSISAQGRSEAAPDMAMITLGVATTGATVEEAMAENTRRMTALVAAVRRAGVAERDIQTAQMSLQPRYERERNQEPRITGYHAANSVRVEVRNVRNVGRVIQAATDAGGNTVQSIAFRHQNPDAQLDIARRGAIVEARRRADLYASALGMRVTRIVSVAEAGAPNPGEIVVTGSRVAREDAVAYAPPPVAPGEIETRAGVSVIFELR